jgi:hypothetical protein
MYPEIEIIENDENLGFAGGNNKAIKIAIKDKYIKYIALLNNDTKIEPNWLNGLVEIAELDDLIGSCQSKILSLSDPTIIDAVGITVTKNGKAIQEGYDIKDLGQYEQIKEILGPCACAALYRKEMLTQIGLFDEDFFAYYEDVDIALRARLAEWKSIYVPKSVVYHLHSSTLGKDSAFKRYLLERNVYYYIFKNLSTIIVIKFLLLRPFSISISILRLIINKKYKLIKYVLRGNINSIKNIPVLLMKRREIQANKSPHNVLSSWIK